MEMHNDIQVGDTIQCKNGADMITTASELAKCGIVVNHIGNYKLEVKVINRTESELEE